MTVTVITESFFLALGLVGSVSILLLQTHAYYMIVTGYPSELIPLRLI